MATAHRSASGSLAIATSACAGSLGGAQQEIHGARFLRVGEGERGELGVRLDLLGHWYRWGEAGLGEGRREHLRADAVQG
jgi:hypothetical protein